jgi:hypothetical protein
MSGLHHAPLEELPQAARALAHATFTAGRELVAKSVSAFTSEGGAASGFLAIRTASVNLRLYLIRQGEQIYFYFVKRQLPDTRVIETNLRIALRAVEDDGVSMPPTYDACSYRLLMPPFLKLRPAAGELRCAPILEFIESLRGWLEGGKPIGEEIPIAMPTLGERMNNVHLTLNYLVEGYLLSELEMLIARGSQVPPPLNLITPFYAVDAYSADVALCLDHQGRFAAPDEPNPVSLNLSLRVARESGVLVAHIALLPPDFLAAGSLRDAFVAALREDNAVTRSLRQTLAMTTGSTFTDFLTRADSRAVVFRTERTAQADTDTVVLPGSWLGSPRTLILVAEVTVSDASTSPKVSLHKVRLVFDSLSDADQALDPKSATYFARLGASLDDWLAVLR